MCQFRVCLVSASLVGLSVDDMSTKKRSSFFPFFLSIYFLVC